MRMIVEAFKESLELGLEKPKQTVVRIGDVIVLPSNTPDEPICLKPLIRLLNWLPRFFGFLDRIAASHFPCRLIPLT